MGNTKNGTRYLEELRAREVRMVLDHEKEHASRSAAILSISQKVGCSRDILRIWVKQHETDTGKRDGLTMAERDRIKRHRVHFERDAQLEPGPLRRMALYCARQADARRAFAESFIDEATGTLMELRFVTSESTWTYSEALERYLLRHGRPVVF